jgi:DUF4097 and DUF4098 domain-containing protein YvlB
MAYCKRCGVELPLDARFCPNCGAPTTEPEIRPMETHRTLKVTGKPRVVVSNTVPGTIEVKPGSEAEVTVDFDLRRDEDLTCNISQEGNVVTVTCRPKVHAFWGWPIYVFSGVPRANILVSVPAETDLNLEARLDRVAVAGVKGSIAAESSTGTISIRDCEGAISARTRTGLVSLKNVNGTVSARNSTGSIKFAGALSKSESWFRTSTGNIELVLQGEPDLIVEAFATLGRITCTPELADGRYFRGQYTGRIGSGTGRVIAETKIGNITIRQQ